MIASGMTPAYHRAMGSKKASSREAAKGGSQQGPDERILSLLMLLLEARRPVAREEIFQRIDAYQTKNPAAGERKFERDKKDLRALGVPIEEHEEKGEEAQHLYCALCARKIDVLGDSCLGTPHALRAIKTPWWCRTTKGEGHDSEG